MKYKIRRRLKKILNLSRYWLLLLISFVLSITIVIVCSPAEKHHFFAPSVAKEIKGEVMTTRLLDQVSTMEIENYNPSYVIQAVNALQPLGKEQALAEIDTYLANRKQAQVGARNIADGLFWVLRVLFEVPTAQGFPPVRIGQPDIPPPTIKEKLPRFPIVLIKDIPLLVVRGYDLGGLPEQVESHVDYFRKFGKIRTQPLQSPTSLNGIEEELQQIWQEAYGEEYITQVLNTIKEQIEKLRN
jgi:hypothetical protein